MGIQAFIWVLSTLSQLSSGNHQGQTAPQIYNEIPAHEVTRYCQTTANLAQQVVLAKNAGWTIDMIMQQMNASVVLPATDNEVLLATVKYVYRDFSDPLFAASTLQSGCTNLFSQQQINAK